MKDHVIANQGSVQHSDLSTIESKPLEGDIRPTEADEALVIMLAEYDALRNTRLQYVNFSENRLKFLLTVVAGVTAGIGLANQFLEDADLITVISIFAYSGLLLFGSFMFMRAVQRSLRITIYSTGERRIRNYFTTEKC